jgi:predicted SAM-dependent methyltransferase
MPKYYDNEVDPMWKWEVEKLVPWFFGKGADIGCGARSIKKDIIRVDIDKKVKPEILASGDKLPFKDNELDYICSIHSFEHFADQHKTLAEWLRVVKVGGIIGIVHPDVNFTKKQKPPEDNASLRDNPYNKHFFEHTQESFIKHLEELADLPFRLVTHGEACKGWSFFVILKKTG